ncbi:MAG: prepilin peptidase [Minisyncoccia bacterium]
MCALMAGLLALGAIDVERLVLPRVLVYTTGLAVAGWLFIATVATHEWHRLLVAIIASAVWFAFFFTINALLPRALGFGDVRLSLLLGFALGWLGAAYPALALFSGSLFGVLVACALIVTSRASRRDPVPFGVFLGAGSAFAVFAGPEIIELLRHAH